MSRMSFDEMHRVHEQAMKLSRKVRNSTVVYIGYYKAFQVTAKRWYGVDLSLAGIHRWKVKAGYAVPKADKVRNQSVEGKPQEPVICEGTVCAPDKEQTEFFGNKFVFTTAQNNTEVHHEFMQSLLVFCSHQGAKLVVGKTTYNKSAFQNGHKGDKSLAWAPELEQYFIDSSVKITKDLVWCGELNILPTAVRPLSGLLSYTKRSSGIVPHVKVALESCPRMKRDAPKFMYTTGAITKRNYIEQKAGQKASFHHVYGALFVEIKDNGEWFARQLIADSSGAFQDLNCLYNEHGVQHVDSVEAVTLGDWHGGAPQDWNVRDGIDDMLKHLKPTTVFVHDATDFRVRNHHNLQDSWIQYRQHVLGYKNVEYELKDALRGLMDLSIKHNTSDVVLVSSNHNTALDIWLKNADFRKDPENATLFLEMQLMIYNKLHSRKQPNVLELFYTRFMDTTRGTLRFLGEDESFRICDDDDDGIECGMHGHLGVNGSRGNPQAFTSLGSKCNTGHTHSAGIKDGVYTAGVSCNLDLEYNKGLTTWSHSHIITYPNGKRCIVTQRGNTWR